MPRGRPRKRSRAWGGSNGQRPRRQNSGDGRSPLAELTEFTPFSVFCALYLGITETDGYSTQDMSTVARRFGVSPAELHEFLECNGLRPQDLKASQFDVTSARLDIQVAPEGISRTELARTLFEELSASGSEMDNGATEPTDSA
jgi:hypothetical protein